MKSYKDIPGWFDFEEIYDLMVSKFFAGGHFVEVGSWLGKSSAYMGQRIRDKEARILFDCVDIWELIDSNKDLHKYYAGDSLYFSFLKNMSDAGVLNYIRSIKLHSRFASELYKDNSLEFVFIDANHEKPYVKQDMDLWYPKVKVGGYIGGHDFGTYDGVATAVVEKFGVDIEVIGISWLKRKTE